MVMNARPSASPVVHLELMTGNLARACVFLSDLFGWTVETVRLEAGTYVTLDLGRGFEGGVVEAADQVQGAWIPYVEVPSVCESTIRALDAGAELAVEPREGPVGWRAVVVTPECGKVALWQPKR